MKVFYLNGTSLRQKILPFFLLMLLGVAVVSLVLQHLSLPASKVSPIYQGNENEAKISFAINVDWGEGYLPAMLEVLEKEKVHCSFFLTGRWTNKFPQLAADIARRGHEIGNHGYKHDSPNQMSLQGVKNDIEKTAGIIREKTGTQTLLYAPPSGERQDHVIEAAHELGYTTILWSIDTIDWKKPNVQIIVAKILDKAHNGAIVLMHPTENTVQALVQVIPALKERGFQLVPVSQNMR